MGETMQAVAAPTRAVTKPLKEVKTIGEALKHPAMVDQFSQALPKHLNVERMIRVCTLCMQRDKHLADADMWSLAKAMLLLASLGMEPNTPLGHAYLIPFDKRAQVGGKWVVVATEVQVILGYRGLIDLARRSGSLVSLHADVVYDGDEFSFEYGSKAHLRHVPKGSRVGRKPLWAYAHARLVDGEAFEVRPYSDVLRIRDGSEGYKSALRSKSQYGDKSAAWAKCPWVAFEHEMAAKTLVRGISKMLPMSIELANAVAIDQMAEVGALDLGSIDFSGATDIDFLVSGDTVAGGEPGAIGHDSTPPVDLGLQQEQEHVQFTGTQESKATRTQERQHESRQDTKPASTPPAADLFGLELVDGDGKVVSQLLDGAGFVARLAAEWRANRDLRLFDANESNINSVRWLGRPADVAALDEIEAEWSAARRPAKTHGSIEPVQVPMTRANKPDVVAYMTSLRASLDCTDAAFWDAWEVAQKPTLETLPMGVKLSALRMIEERRAGL